MKIQEGMLYKEITVFDKTFKIYYGYYDEKDRTGKYNDPVPIFPNFKVKPLYTDEGYPFVTHMQDACEWYSGNIKTESCYSCAYFQQGEDLIGLCKCWKNKNNA